jgi:hypothetical protein
MRIRIISDTNVGAKGIENYERVALGAKGRIKGLVEGKDASWLLFPLFVFIRGIAYSYTYAKNLIYNEEGK